MSLKNWDYRDNLQRLSLEDSLTRIREYVASIRVARTNLLSVYTLLKTQTLIQPDQCTYLIDLAHMMDHPVQDLSYFLDQRNSLPVAILPLRSQLVIELLSIKEQLWTVLALAGSLRPARQAIPQTAAMKRYTMLHKLEALLQESNELLQIFQTLSDQAHFQESTDAQILDRTILLKDNVNNNSNNKEQNICNISFYRKK